MYIFSQLIFMDQIESICPETVQIKSEQCIVLKMKSLNDREKDIRVVLTTPVCTCVPPFAIASG